MYAPEYLELPSFPPPLIDDLTQGKADDHRSQVSRIVYKKTTGSTQKPPAIGYSATFFATGCIVSGGISPMEHAR